MVKKISLLILIALSLSSCVSSEKIHYFQNSGQINAEGKAQNFETKLTADDQLMIFITAADPQSAAPFNLPIISVSGLQSGTLDLASSNQRYQTYLIDAKGEIQFPVVGTIKLGGLTKTEAVAKLNTELVKYMKDPIINMRIINFKISVLGEVLRPGQYSVTTERVTIPDALGMASDLTIYGNRKEVTIIRDFNGVKTYNIVDITSADLVNSPYYYLSQNDIVYVKPNNTRVNSSAIGPNTTVIISALSLLLTTIALLTR